MMKLIMQQVADIPSIALSPFIRAIWNEQMILYDRMFYYFSGEVFEEKLSAKKQDLKYPMKDNIFASACFNHRSVLMGEFEDPVLSFRVRSRNKDKELVENVIEKIWDNSGRNAILLEQALLCQIFGGMVLCPKWDGVYNRVVIVPIEVTTFFPVWDPENYRRLLEVIIVYNIDARTAKWKWNVDVSDAIMESGDTVMVYEHWTEKIYEFVVNAQPAFWDPAKTRRVGGTNPYIDPTTGRGIIPHVYFPRDRAGSFYGLPLGKDGLGLQDEYNKRGADLGDAIVRSTHLWPFLRNRVTGRKGLERPSHTSLNDLGFGTVGRDAPDVFTVDRAKIPAGAIEWTQGLKNDARTAMFSPGMAYGDDDTSQRSGAALQFRMWPTTSACRVTRGYWADSFRALHRHALIIAAIKGGSNINLERHHHEYYTYPVWAAMLPKDREQVVNEVVVRKQSGIMSAQNAVETLEQEDTEWVQEELKRIEQDQNKESKLAQAAQAVNGRFGGAAPPKESISE